MTYKHDRLRIRLCIIVNLALLLIIVCISAILSSHNKYFRVGPNKELILLDIHIDNWYKYLIVQILIFINQVIDIIINDIATPILGFTIFNPDKKYIVGYGRYEIQLYANTMWLINNLRGVLTVLVTISQIDIAILRVVYSEITSIFTIYYLLKDKEFVGDNIELDNI
jgi:hypothetical protein